VTFSARRQVCTTSRRVVDEWSEKDRENAPWRLGNDKVVPRIAAGGDSKVLSSWLSCFWDLEAENG
jgi:hypothetical protein